MGMADATESGGSDTPGAGEQQYHIQVVKTRLNPGTQVESLLFSYTGAVNAVYNKMLWISRQVRGYRRWQQEQGVPEDQWVELVPVFSTYALSKYINAVKADIWKWSDQVSKHAFEDAARALSAAFINFKQRGYKGYPRYRKRKKTTRAGRHSVSLFEVKRGWLNQTGTRIDLPAPTPVKKDRFGLNSKQTIQIPISRDRRMKRAAKLIHTGRATVQQVTFSYAGGHWWVSVRLRVAAQHMRQYPRPAVPAGQVGPRVLGVDASLGQHTWAHVNGPVNGYTDPDGIIRLPDHMRQTHKKLVKAQRWLSRTDTGSVRNRKALLRVQKLNHKLSAQRRRWLDQMVTSMLQNYEIIVIEDLSLNGLSRRKPGRRLSFGAAVGSGSHGLFRQLLETKQHRYRGATQVVVADRWFPSSKTCSTCGSVKTKLELQMRTYKCNTCGVILDRDHNAALNLAGYGLRSVTRQVQEEVPVVTRGSYAGGAGYTGTCSKQVDHKTRTDRPVTAATLPVSV